MVYFVDEEHYLVEWNLKTWQELKVMSGVDLLTGVPPDAHILAASTSGKLWKVPDDPGKELYLHEVFENGPKFVCTAVIGTSVVANGSYAVVAVQAMEDILKGGVLPRPRNYFLLVDVGASDLAVANKHEPLFVDWWCEETKDETIRYMRCFRRKRLHLILAVSYRHRIFLFVQAKTTLQMLHEVVAAKDAQVWNEGICVDAADNRRWLVGGVGGADEKNCKGFIKSIRIVYK